MYLGKNFYSSQLCVTFLTLFESFTSEFVLFACECVRLMFVLCMHLLYRVLVGVTHAVRPSRCLTGLLAGSTCDLRESIKRRNSSRQKRLASSGSKTDLISDDDSISVASQFSGRHSLSTSDLQTLTAPSTASTSEIFADSDKVLKHEVGEMYARRKLSLFVIVSGRALIKMYSIVITSIKNR